MKSRLKAKIKRKYWQRMRIYKVYLLCKAYEMYHMMQIHAACSKVTLTYKEAEEVSDTMNSVFGVNTQPEYFITDQDEQCNLAIEFYEKLQDILTGLKMIEQESILSFCKSVYFGNKCIGLKVEGYILYSIYFEEIIKYLSDYCTLSDVRDSIVNFKPWFTKPRKIDSSQFRKDFIRIEELYKEIYAKKVKRLKKKSL